MFLQGILATTGDGTEAAVTPSLSLIILAGVALSICLIIVLGLFLWARRLQIEGALKNRLLEGVSRMELERLMIDLDDKAWMQPLDPTGNPFPEDARKIGLSHSLYLRSEAYRESNTELVHPTEFIEPPLPENYDSMNKQMKSTYDQMIQDEKNRWIALEKGRKAYLDWEKKELENYNKEKEKMIETANERAKDVVPKSMDISILGSGFSFLLEFSTVIVIIFALISLGILGVLEGREIGTILAAIAGYVLGKATGWMPNKTETEKPSQPSSQKK